MRCLSKWLAPERGLAARRRSHRRHALEPSSCVAGFSCCGLQARVPEVSDEVEQVIVELPVNRIIFRLESAGPVLREVQAASLKGDLARAVFQRDLVFIFDDEEIKPPAAT